MSGNGKRRAPRKAAPKAPGAAPAPAVTLRPRAAKVIVAAAPAPAAPVPEPRPAADWELALLALYAEDAFETACNAPGADLTHPAPDPRLGPWRIVGTITGTDAWLRIGRRKVGARTVFYGWLLRGRGGELVLAIRGTGLKVEWLMDGLFAPRAPHSVAGRVESGFWDVYSSLRIDGKPISSIAEYAAGTPITVVGHSLGAALATYACFELARAGAKVRGVFIASPHPGDAKFCEAFADAVAAHVAYVNPADLVPRVPFWFGYQPVPNVVDLSAAKSGITIKGGKRGQHHVLTYAALMTRGAALDSFKALPVDREFLDCIHR